MLPDIDSKPMATFLANEINTIERDMTGMRHACMFLLTDKNNAGYLKTFLRVVDE